MRYIVDDEVVVDTSISTDSPKVDVDVITGEQVTSDTELIVAGTSLSTDLIIEETKVEDIAVTTPYGIISNEETPTMSPLQIVDYSISSIECSFDVTTEQAEEVVKGVLCGTTNPPTFENADYRLLHGQGSMDLAFAGLHVNTEYYLRPYALSNLGYKYGDVITQRTKPSPIPDEYQLVEYLESTGTQYIDLNYISQPYSGIYVEATIFTQATSFGQAVGNGWFGFSYNQQNHMVVYTNNRYFITNVLSVLRKNAVWKFNYMNDGIISCNDSEASIGAILRPTLNSLFMFALNKGGGRIDESSGHQIFNCRISEENNIVRNYYSVYRKADHKPGMYDIVNNQFYTNQGAGEFIVGPDTEWNE